MEYRLPLLTHLAQGVQKMITKNNEHRSKETEKENYRLMLIQDRGCRHHS